MKKHLSTLPQILYTFVWSDYVELLVMASVEFHFAKEAFLTLLLNNQISKQKRGSDQRSYSPQEGDILWQKLIKHCQFRATTLKRHYPFAVAEDLQSLTFKFIKTQPQQRLYLGALLAASRKHLPSACHDEITRDFSQVCHQLFTHLMPEGTKIQRLPALVHQFPKHEQVSYMAKVSRGEVLLQAKDYEQDAIDLSDSLSDASQAKSGIVDLLAWHPMGDERDAIPVALGRCDCETERWLSSQQTLLNLDAHFYTRHPCMKYHFSPIDLYNENQDWALKERLGRVILLDRYRILKLAEEYFIYNDLPDWTVLDSICHSLQE